MSKKYQIKDSVTGNIFEETDSIETAEKLLHIIRAGNSKVIIFTPNEEEIDNKTYQIEGLNVVEPTEEFGSSLNDEFGDDEGPISPEEFNNL